MLLRLFRSKTRLFKRSCTSKLKYFSVAHKSSRRIVIASFLISVMTIYWVICSLSTGQILSKRLKRSTYLDISNKSFSVNADVLWKETSESPKSDLPKIHTKEGCPFQNVDPYDPAIIQYLYKYDPLNCTGRMPVIVYVDDENKLRVNWTKVNNTIGKLDHCEYTRLELWKNDSQLRPFKWSRKFLSSPLQLTDEDEQVWVRCFLNKKIVSYTFEGRVFKKPKVEERCEENYNRSNKEHDPSETMSVVVIGVDGMSKQNLIRAMPKTRDFIINKLKAKELYKFNKIGDNTYPNVLGLHSGLKDKELKINWNWRRYFDEINDKFIWHHYQNAGYRTGMIFDATYLTAYHYLKKGWKDPKFDYYPRALRLAMEEDNKYRHPWDNCLDDVPEMEVLQDYVIRIMSLFNNTRSNPYFIYSFFTKMTHRDNNVATKGDDIYFNFFKKLERKKILNNTIIIFFSDHGSRFGEFRETYNGKIEVNIPFVFFMFPPWFERKYSHIMETFRINQNRLTTFFDIHQTLSELIKFKGETTKGKLSSRGISLFDEIPIERNCSHAGIPMEFCNCKLLSNEMVTNKITKVLAEGLLKSIVNKTKNYRNMCALLEIKSVLSILTMKTSKNELDYYQTTISTEPGGGVYEALVKYDRKLRMVTVSGDIIRLNLYKGQDACMDELQLKLFCFCVSQ